MLIEELQTAAKIPVIIVINRYLSCWLSIGDSDVYVKPFESEISITQRIMKKTPIICLKLSLSLKAK
jgi:hypothetical protein